MGVLRPEGSLPARVYWVRRLVVLAAVVAVVLIAAWAVPFVAGKAGDLFSGAKGAAPAPTTTTSAAVGPQPCAPASLGLTLAAVLGKLAAGIGAAKGGNRLAVSFGMMPRGEVSLIFASLGLTLGVLDHRAYSALVVMVVLTTLATPFGLKWSFARGKPAEGEGPRSRAVE